MFGTNNIKRHILGILFLLTASFNAIAAKPITIFYIPHQDDEVLTFSTAIVNHIWAQHEVHLVLYTDGAPTVGTVNGVLAKLNASLNDPIRVPLSESIDRSPITPERVVNARNDEFMAAALALGVKRENIHFDPVHPNKANLRSLILQYETLYSNGSQFPQHKTMSYNDVAHSHRVSGLALRELYEEGLIHHEPRFYVRLLQMEGNINTYAQERSTLGVSIIDGSLESYLPAYQHHTKAAIDSYLFHIDVNDLTNINSTYALRDWTAMFRMGDLAVGAYHSITPKRFLDIRNSPRSYYHNQNIQKVYYTFDDGNESWGHTESTGYSYDPINQELIAKEEANSDPHNANPESDYLELNWHKDFNQISGGFNVKGRIRVSSDYNGSSGVNNFCVSLLELKVGATTHTTPIRLARRCTNFTNTFDSGWHNFDENFSSVIKNNSKVRVVIGSKDAWGTNWNQKIRIDSATVDYNSTL